jgi:pheromone a factor receptor
MLLGSFPVQLYVLYFNITNFMPWAPFSWSVVHGPQWGEIEKVPANGRVFFDRWIHVTAGFLLFAFFGLGKDATLMYRSWLLKAGLGRFFTSLKDPHVVSQQQRSSSTLFGSVSSRAKMIFSKKSLRSGNLIAPWYGNLSTVSPTSGWFVC